MKGSRGSEREAKSPLPEENIMNLLPRPPVVVRKPKRYVSRHHGRVVEEARGRDSHATLGKAAPAHPPSPAHYLKKGHRDQYTHALVSSKYALTTGGCGMNWIAGNVSRVEEAARARRSAGLLRKHVAVDDLGGHRQDRLSAGLHPRYVFKKGLHTNLKEAQRRLQSLPVVCETLASRARRDQLEKRVMDLQRYIFLLQNHTLAVSE
ncbi:hypothetical protein O3P69_015847 [Scylla paramamosain]|uniref:Enkurin domain-containing protein n=1 Tax=Scylla paramamosain TaxID=85552 RepID=A0AAW0TB92_SCYPA